MQTSEPSPSISSNLTAETVSPVRPRRSPVSSVSELTSVGPADAARPTNPAVAPVASVPDSVEISVLSRSILAEPEPSPRIESLGRAYDSRNYQVDAEALARTLVEKALERNPILLDGGAEPARGGRSTRKAD